jgi:CheY-like chemotaxis protein
MGIVPEEMGNLFTPFSRLGADRRGVEGTGLGLALSKNLVETMGGSIAAQSVPGEGSTFRIELAIAEPAEVQDELPKVASPFAETAESRTILYIEDNLANLQLIEGILAYRPSIGLMSSMQGSLGIEIARLHQPDLILLDLHLPDMSGDEILERLKTDEATSAIPVVIVSADANRDTLKRLEDAGASSFVTKPVNVQLFLETVDEMLAQE